MRKNFKKMVALPLAFALSAAMFSGCAEKKGKDDEKKVITVWTNDRSGMDIRTKQVEKFNAENEYGIKIDYQVKGDDLEDSLKVAYQSNNAPDIHVAAGSVTTYGKENGWFRALDDDMAHKYEELFVPGAISFDKETGKCYTVNTSGVSSFRFIWNKDMFKDAGLDPEKPPKTFDEMREYAKILTEKGNGTKYGFALPLKDAVFVRYYVTMPGAPSGLYNADGYDPVNLRFDFNIYGKMIDYLKGLIKDGSVFPAPNTLDNDLARAQFSEGNIGMMYAASWDVGVLNDQFPAKCDWGIADFPTFTGEVVGGNPATMGGSGGFYMNAKSKYPDEQLKVFEWLISEENLKELKLAGKGTYGLKSILGEEYITSEKKGAKEFASVTNPAFIIDTPSNRPTTKITLEGDSSDMTIKNILIADLDTKSELEKLTERYNNALKKLGETTDLEQFRDPNWTGIEVIE